MAFGYVTISDGFTLEIWAMQNGVSGRHTAIFTQYTQANATWGTLGTTRGRQLYFGINPTGALYLDVNDKNGVNRISWTDPTPQNVIDNEWHHLAVRLANNKRTFTVFVDGLPIATVSSSVDIVWNAGSMTVGAHYQPKFGAFGVYHWPGRFAYAAARDVALSDNRIWEHYAAGKGGAVYYGDSEVTRINRILDWANVPLQSRQLDSAMVTMQGIEVTDANALEKVQEAAEAATGYTFADGQTRILYHNRQRRYNKYSVFTFSEEANTAVELGIVFSMDNSRVFNDIRGSRPFGSTVRMVDQESIDTYGRKVATITLPITSHEELRNAVGWFLSRYKIDRLRVERVTIEASTSDAMLPAATGKLQVGDMITLDGLPGNSPLSTMDFTIEGISLDVDFKRPHWKVSFNLSPADIDRVFEIGVSALGGGDKVAY